jgi:hypothetical protein
MIHEYEGSDAFSPELVRADESFLHAQRPADDDGGFATQVLEQFANVAPAPRRMVSLRRLLRTTLPARVEGHHPMGRAEVSQLRLPDPRRHSPAGHKHEGRAGSRFQVVEFDAVARHEVAALKLPLSPCGLRGQYACDGEQDREEDSVLFHNAQLLFVSWLWVRVSHLISNTMMSPNIIFLCWFRIFVNLKLKKALSRLKGARNSAFFSRKDRFKQYYMELS